MKIYVGNLAYEVTDQDLKSAFDTFGEVTSASVVKDYNGRSKGFGFIEMSVETAAKAAIEGLNGKELKGRAIVVNEARPRVPDGRSRYSGQSRTGGYGGGGGGGGGGGRGFGGRKGGAGGSRGGGGGGGGGRRW